MGRSPISDAEWPVMEALWAQAPATVREVRERLRGTPSWAYSTVKTLLDRLVDKDVVVAEADGVRKRYRAAPTREAALHRATHDLADKAFGGRIGALMHFLAADETLGPADRARLREMLGDDEEQTS